MILSAKSIQPQQLPQSRFPLAKAGLAYERKFVLELKKSIPKGMSVYPSQWFEYRDSADSTKTKTCCVDFLIEDEDEGYIIVGEIKQTWTELAQEKLTNLYCPVVFNSAYIPVKPLVVCKTLTNQSPLPRSTITFSLLSDNPLYQWIGMGPVQW